MKKYLAPLVALVFIGAGCAGSGSGSVQTTQPSAGGTVNVGGGY
jgi:hypothetical protein